ncbi:hypothetical protein VpasPP24_34 [Vibrio phage Vpas_PP24]|nr:hypothetical protein VpasPP24_34 [Vibrio phage Vpas_PP24]
MSDTIPTDAAKIEAELQALLAVTPTTTERGRLFHLIRAAMGTQSGGGVPLAPEGYLRGYAASLMDAGTYPLPTDPSIVKTQSVVHCDLLSLSPLNGDAPNVMSSSFQGAVNPQAFLYKDKNTRTPTTAYVGVNFDVNNDAKAYVFGQGATANLNHVCQLGSSGADYDGSNAYVPVSGIHAEYDNSRPLVAQFKKINGTSFSVELFDVSGNTAESLGGAATVTVPTLDNRTVAFEQSLVMLAYDFTNDRVFLNFINSRIQTIAMWDIGVTPVVTNLYQSTADRRSGGTCMIKHFYSYNMTSPILVYSKSTTDSSLVDLAFRSASDNYATETVLEAGIPVDDTTPVREIVQSLSTNSNGDYWFGVSTTLTVTDDTFRYWKIDNAGTVTAQHINLGALRAHPKYTKVKGCAIWMDENSMYGSTGTYLGLVNDDSRDMDIYALETFLQGDMIPLGQQHFTDSAFGYPVVNHCDDYQVLSAKTDDQNCLCFGVMETWNYWSVAVPQDVNIVNNIADGTGDLWAQALASGVAVNDVVPENPLALGLAMPNAVYSVIGKHTLTGGGGFTQTYYLDFTVAPKEGGVMILNKLQPVTIPSNAPDGSAWLFLGADNVNSEYNNESYRRIGQSGAVTAQQSDGSVLPLGIVSPKHTRAKAASGMFTAALYVEKVGENQYKTTPLI